MDHRFVNLEGYESEISPFHPAYQPFSEFDAAFEALQASDAFTSFAPDEQIDFFSQPSGIYQPESSFALDPETTLPSGVLTPSLQANQVDVHDNARSDLQQPDGPVLTDSLADKHGPNLGAPAGVPNGWPDCEICGARLPGHTFPHYESHFGKKGDFRCQEPHCPAAQKAFPRWAELARHYRTAHCKAVKKLYCEVLGCKYRERGFARKDKLRDHIRNVHEGKFKSGKPNRPLRAALKKTNRLGYEA